LRAIFGDSPCHAGENVGGQIFDTDPRQNEKAGVISKEANIASTRLGAPADITVATAQVPWRRTPGQARDRTLLGPHQILGVLSHGLLIFQIVVLLEQAVEQPLLGSAPDLSKLQGPDPVDTAFEQSRIDLCRSRTCAPYERVGGHESHGWQLNLASTLEHEQQAAAHHVAQRAVGLFPLPCQAKLLRQPAPALTGMR